MFKREYVIGTVKNVKELVNLAGSCIEDIDLGRGRHIVDMKSILGVFSLDLSQPTEVHIHTDDAARAEEIFEKIEAVLRG